MGREAPKNAESEVCNMNLREVLGVAYKEDMSLADVEAALRGLDMVDRSEATKGTVSKATFDKTASDLAAMKRQLRERMTEDEQAKQDRETEHQKIMEELESLRKKDAINQHLGRYLKLGYDEALAQDTAESMVAQDFDRVYANQQAFLSAHDKAMQKQMVMANDKRPPAGDGTTGTDYNKLAVQAGENGDFSAQAYYLRLAQQGI